MAIVGIFHCKVPTLSEPKESSQHPLQFASIKGSYDLPYLRPSPYLRCTRNLEACVRLLDRIFTVSRGRGTVTVRSPGTEHPTFFRGSRSRLATVGTRGALNVTFCLP